MEPDLKDRKFSTNEKWDAIFRVHCARQFGNNWEDTCLAGTDSKNWVWLESPDRSRAMTLHIEAADAQARVGHRKKDQGGVWILEDCTDGEAAEFTYLENGDLRLRTYFLNGRRHDPDINTPAVTYYRCNPGEQPVVNAIAHMREGKPANSPFGGPHWMSYDKNGTPVDGRIIDADGRVVDVEGDRLNELVANEKEKQLLLLCQDENVLVAKGYGVPCDKKTGRGLIG